MLAIKEKRTPAWVKIAVSLCAILLLVSGAYILCLVAAPSVAPMVFTKPISLADLPAPKQSDNRIVIPKIGVNIVYDKGVAALDRGAQWRYPERGNPETGGNFIIAAHRFSIQPTPQSTVEKSPFYNIDKMARSDKIFVDYNGKRYAYEISDIFDASPDQTEIEKPSTEPKLTLYSCELGGSKSGRIVIIAKPMGQVAINE